MYVTVLYGEKEESIFNPNCRCITLLTNIREKCSCGFDIDLELSDENGNIKHLRDHPYSYATDILREREKLVLLRVEKMDKGEPQYTPLLNDEDFISETFLAHLSSKSGSDLTGRRHRSSQSRRTSRHSGTDIIKNKLGVISREANKSGKQVQNRSKSRTK